MALQGNNVQNVKFLRNQTPFESRELARQALENNKAQAADGTALLARYTITDGQTTDVKTLVGFVAEVNSTKYVTIIDVEGGSADVEKLREEINAKLGTTFISSGNTVEANLTALSGNAQSTSAETSVAGAKKYADGLIESLDYTDAAVEGQYVSQVTQADGKIAVKRVELPSLTEVKESGKPIVAVSEDKGQVAASAGTINAEFVDIADSGEKFAATTVEGALAEIATEIDAMDLAVVSGDGEVITAVSEEDGKVSASKTAIKDVKLTGYVKNTEATGTISGTDDIEDALSKLENTISSNAISNEDGSITVTPANGSTTDVKLHIKDGEKVIKLDASKGGIYTDIDLVKITENLPTEIKERYQLLASDDTQIGANIDIPKDSHIVSINYITTGDHAQNLEYVYIDASGNTQTTYVDMSELVLEAEFASGVTITEHVAHGVVDPTSEANSNNVAFLTVGADGFKISGIKDEIDRKINALDATGGTQTIATDKHVAVEVVETNGLITTVTVTEDNIANANDLAALSAKTVTEIGSSNNSVEVSTATTTAADGTVKYNVITDADKIQMSGFSADNTSALSGIAESDSIATAFEKANTVITENERVTAEALNDLNSRVYVIESGYVETVKVNNVALAETDNAVNVQISSTAASGAESSPIIVNTDNSTGAVTLQIQNIDCGTY